MKKFVSILLAALMAFAIMASPAFAKSSDSIPGYDKDGAKNVNYHDATKADADMMSVKIPSNAHYDVLAPTVYFDWDAKQKDDGYLTVSSEYFESYESLTIVVKASSEYRKAVVTEPGTYLINKFTDSKGKVHNINMVWIGNFVEKKIPVYSYQRDFVVSNNSDDALNAASEGAVTEIYTVLDEYYNGSTAGHWASTLSNAYPEFCVAMTAILADEDAYVPDCVWHKAYFDDPNLAVSGSTVVFEKKFTPLDVFTDSEYSALGEDDEIPLYVAGDNALLVFVNGKYVGQSSSVVNKYALEDYDADYLYNEIINDRTEPYILYNDWRAIYKFDIRPFLIAGAENTVTIIGVNEAADDIDGFREDYAREPGKNPAGLIFSFELYSMSVK